MKRERRIWRGWRYLKRFLGFERERREAAAQNARLEPIGRCVCGVEIFETVPDSPADPPGVAHALPYCEEFLQLEVIEFLRYVRRSRGIPDDRN